MKRLPNVLLMINADFESGRQFIAGISEYAQHFGPWRIHWVSERDEGPPAPLTWSELDGVIGTNPPIHATDAGQFNSEGDWHEDESSYCYQCHMNLPV